MNLSKPDIKYAVAQGWAKFPIRTGSRKKAALRHRRFWNSHPEYREKNRQQCRDYYRRVLRGSESRRKSVREAMNRLRWRRIIRKLSDRETEFKKKLWGTCWKEQARKLAFQRRSIHQRMDSNTEVESPKDGC